MKRWFIFDGILAALLLLNGCVADQRTGTALNPQTTLKDAFKNDFLIGVALTPRQFTEENLAETALVKQQFNSITPENVMKWRLIHPGSNRFDFSLADRYVEFGIKNNMVIIGHNLIWPERTPDWVFQDAQGNPVDRATLLARMREHILTVVGRYKGKIRGWDVVNEALNNDGSLQRSQWFKILGEDYLLKAYQFAHEADPDMELYYNDYGLENPAKRAGAIKLLKKLRKAGVEVSAIGLQGHYEMTWPHPEQIDETIGDFARLHVKVMITELDLDMLPHAAASAQLNPYPNGIPDVVQERITRRYMQVFKIFLKHRAQISRVTFWGVDDGDSWLNNWPIKGRTAYPLLFDRSCQPKPALAAIVKTAEESKR